MTTAEALRRLAGARDPAAWEALLEQNGNDILRICRRILGDPMLAEDACQETLLQIRAHAGAFKAPASAQEAQSAARVWIMKIASCTALNLLRSRARTRQREESAAHEAGARDAAACPAARQLQEEEAAFLRQEVAGLPDDLRDSIVLRFYGELEYIQLGAALSCTTAAAKKRVQRGLERLRTRLALLGLALTLADLAANLSSKGLQAAEAAAHAATATSAATAALDATHHAAWQALLNTTSAPALAGVVPAAGLTLAAKLALAAAGLVLAATGAVAVQQSIKPAPPSRAGTPVPPPAAAGRGDRPVGADQPPPKDAKPAPAPVNDPTIAEVRKKLERKVTFEFVDTPLDEALTFLSQLVGVKMTLDPKVAASAKTKINLRVTDMTVDLALQWVLKLADLDYLIADGAVVVWKPGARAAPAASPAAPAGDSGAWVQDTRKKLSRKVSFEFVDTPLEEAIAFLNSLAKVNIIIDPKVAAKGATKTAITLRVQDMEMGTALTWVLRLANLKYEFRDGAVFITEAKPEELNPAPPADKKGGQKAPPAKATPAQEF